MHRRPTTHLSHQFDLLANLSWRLIPRLLRLIALRCRTHLHSLRLVCFHLWANIANVAAGYLMRYHSRCPELNQQHRLLQLPSVITTNATAEFHLESALTRSNHGLRTYHLERLSFLQKPLRASCLNCFAIDYHYLLDRRQTSFFSLTLIYL